MSSFFTILSVINFFGLIYLVFIVYRKNQKNSLVVNDQKTISNSLSKLSLTRFNPFEELGGDQSFILCLLDNTNTGVIITSLHNRDYTRVYAKYVYQSKADNATLSSEEKEALLKTIKQKT